MTSCIFEYDCIDEKIQSKIKEWIEARSDDFSLSQLYIPLDDEKIVDEERRRSKFRTFTDSDIFYHVDKLISVLNEYQDEYRFIMVKNDVTHIRYKEGDFFEQHKDYLSLHTNMALEYTMLICIDSECEGGRTKFHLNSSFIHSCEKTTHNNGVVVFRKDLVHEGEKLKSGHKEIISINLWAIEKSNDKVIVLECSDNLSYILPFSKIMRYSNHLSEMYKLLPNDDNIVRLQLSHTYEQINVIYKIFTDQMISVEEYKTYSDILDYYRIPISEILTYIDDHIANTIQIGNEGIKYGNVHIFKNESEMTYWGTQFKELGEKYFTFGLAFVEGTTFYSSEGTSNSKSYEFEPVCKMVNDVVIEGTSILHGKKELLGVFDYDISYPISDNIYNIDMCDVFSDAYYEKKVGSDAYDGNYNLDYCECFDKMRETEVYEHEKTCEKYKLCEYADLIPVEDIKNLIIKENIKFVFPQEHEDINHSFCNENMYGSVNLIKVFGIVKL